MRALLIAATLCLPALLALLLFDPPTAVFLLIAVGLVTLCGAAAVGFGVATRRAERRRAGSDDGEAVVLRDPAGPRD